MSDTLKDLYNGKIYPAEQFCPTDPEYRRLSEAVVNAFEALRHDLGGDYAARLEALDTLCLELSSAQIFESFQYGFRLGARLAYAACS